MQIRFEPRSKPRNYVYCTTALVIQLFVVSCLPANQLLAQSNRETKVDPPTEINIVRAEDERRFDSLLQSLLKTSNAFVRSRAALAAGRIGDKAALPALADMLRNDTSVDVRQMSAFAIGEIEASAEESDSALIAVAQNASATAEVRARSIEAIAKITAAMPKEDKARAELGAAIVAVMRSEQSAAQPDSTVILKSITAALRARPEGAAPIVAGFLSNRDPRIRGDALNTLARLRAKESLATIRRMLSEDVDPVVRANAARALGAAEDAESFDLLATHGLNDADERVRVSTIRTLGSLKDKRSVSLLIAHASPLLEQIRKSAGGTGVPAPTNEFLEIATALGRIEPGTDDLQATNLFTGYQIARGYNDPEVEVAFATIAPDRYLKTTQSRNTLSNHASAVAPVSPRLSWRETAAIAQALATYAPAKTETKQESLSRALEVQKLINQSICAGAQNGCVAAQDRAFPDLLRAYSAFKPDDLSMVLRSALAMQDPIIRATAAELLGDLPFAETNDQALLSALPRAMHDDLNDAALSILDTLGKYKSAADIAALKSALVSNDPIVRQRAVTNLKTVGAGDLSSRLGTVRSRNTTADYTRAIARERRNVTATIDTQKGRIVIALLAENAPLTVDNFIQLANRGYFNGLSFHRVVPNFVAQGGDPRGDGNGGPGYQIRCEINEEEYDRGAVGMALSGKDTGGSQWFITHSPQPHLDGGYTVFGRVINGMDVVDRIARGDKIVRVRITEGPMPKSRMKKT